MNLTQQKNSQNCNEYLDTLGEDLKLGLVQIAESTHNDP